MAGRDSCPPLPTLADDLRSVAGGSRVGRLRDPRSTV